jgi:ATP-dependent DNA ligase
VFIRDAVATLSLKISVMDGEVVAIGKGGRPDFQQLRRGLGKQSSPFPYCAFDLLVLDGRTSSAGAQTPLAHLASEGIR